MAKGIYGFYKDTITTAWELRFKPLEPINEGYAAKIVEVKLTPNQLKAMAESYRRWDESSFKNLI